MNVFEVNGYGLYALKIFNMEYRRLQAQADKLISKAEKLYAQGKVELAEQTLSKPAVKLFEAVRYITLNTVPANPNDKGFRLGNNMLGKKFNDWRRVKRKTLPDRYRLFFRFNSTPPKSIVYAWLNDETCLRKDGARTDAYHVFKGKLEAKKVPNSWDDLIAEAVALELNVEPKDGTTE